jgi:exopolysaccharide biosynthesis protein
VRQCVLETSPDRSGCPSSEKRCDVGTRVYAGKCPEPNDRRARTAVGKTADGQLIVLVVPESDGLTLYELRDTLLGLGAVDGMNLDGGRSSQLWYDGDYLVPPEREVASALLVFSVAR